MPEAPAAGRSRWRAAWARLRGDWLFWTLVVLTAALTLLDPARVRDYPALVDWHTIAVLAGLLVLTRGLEESGALHRTARALLLRVRTERGLALALVGLAAGLSTVITNDVALFVVVPIVLALRGVGVPVARLVIFTALAVNAGSALTPIGNPQNIFLWGFSGAPFTAFTAAMAPVVWVMTVGLAGLTALAFSGRPLVAPAEPPEPLGRPLFAVSLGLYAPFLLLVNAGQTGLAVAAVALPFVVAFRRVLAGVDWPLLAVFVLMFVAFRLVADLGPVRGLLGAVPLAEPGAVYLTAAALSQVVSNVPAAIVLAEYTRAWVPLAWGVSVGGFGLVVGSLANIIALRMLGEGRAWATFHVWSVPFGLAATAAGWAGLRWLA